MVDGRVTLAPTVGPAPWAFLVGRAFLAAVPADTDDTILQALAAFASQHAVDLESMVTFLPQSGDAALASFALVVPVAGSDTVSVLVRGASAVDVYSIGGSRRFAAGGVLPWLLADFQAVTGIVIGDAEEAPGPLDHGGVAYRSAGDRGGRLTWIVGAHADERTVDDTVLVGDPSRLFAAGSDTVVRPNPAIGDTVVLPSSPPRPGPELAERGEALPRYGFRLGTATYRLDDSYLLGRQPRAPRIHAGREPRLLAVPSPTRSVSGTHLEIRQDGDAVVVTDLGSTNGTMLRPPAGSGERLRQRTSRAVVPGTRVDIGDGNIVEILPVSGDESSLPPARNRKAQP